MPSNRKYNTRFHNQLEDGEDEGGGGYIDPEGPHLFETFAEKHAHSVEHSQELLEQQDKQKKTARNKLQTSQQSGYGHTSGVKKHPLLGEAAEFSASPESADPSQHKTEQAANQDKEKEARSDKALQLQKSLDHKLGLSQKQQARITPTPTQPRPY